MRSRTRTTYEYRYSQPTYYLSETTGKREFVYNPNLHKRPVCIETMTDDIGRGRATKYCMHQKSTCTAKGDLSWRTLSGNAPNRVFQSVTLFGQPYHAVGMVVTTSVSEAQAYRDMVNGAFNEQVLAPVFFKELPELKSTFNELRKAEFGVKSFANKFLAFKFGILPFIGDLSNMYSMHKNIQNHIKVVNEAGRGQKFVQHCKVGSISGHDSILVPTSSNTSVVNTSQWLGSVRGYLKGFYSRRYTRGDEINAYLDTFGANLLACGWEAIPYSFVVDWFLQIGDYINYLVPKHQEPMVTVLDSGTLVKASISLPLVWWDDYTNSPVNFGARNTKYFLRTPSAPVPSSILGSGLTLSRLSTAAAMIIQKT